MQICFKCSGPLQNANGEATYNIGEKMIIGSKVLGVYFEFEIWEKNYCPTCMMIHYDLAIINEDEPFASFLLCPGNRIERRKL